MYVCIPCSRVCHLLHMSWSCIMTKESNVLGATRHTMSDDLSEGVLCCRSFVSSEVRACRIQAIWSARTLGTQSAAWFGGIGLRLSLLLA